MTALLKESPPGWWPVDRLLAGYFGVQALLIAAFFPRIPRAALLLAAHAAAIALIVWAVRARPRSTAPAARALAVFRHWYPLPYVASCYWMVAVLIPPIRGVEYDEAVARWDHALWAVHPTVWLERFSTPWLTELLQIAYALFVPAVLLVGVWLWRQRRYERFRYYAFLIALGFLASYAGYFLAPVRGPRFLLAAEQTVRLEGLWLFEWLQQTLNRLESAHWDCFPSGHVALTLLAWRGSRFASARLSRVFAIYSLAVALATVYLRYHYTIDVAAGAALAAVVLAAGAPLYRMGTARAATGGTPRPAPPERAAPSGRGRTAPRPREAGAGSPDSQW